MKYKSLSRPLILVIFLLGYTLLSLSAATIGLVGFAFADAKFDIVATFETDDWWRKTKVNQLPICCSQPLYTGKNGAGSEISVVHDQLMGLTVEVGKPALMTKLTFEENWDWFLDWFLDSKRARQRQKILLYDFNQITPELWMSVSDSFKEQKSPLKIAFVSEFDVLKQLTEPWHSVLIPEHIPVDFDGLIGVTIKWNRGISDALASWSKSDGGNIVIPYEMAIGMLAATVGTDEDNEKLKNLDFRIVKSTVDMLKNQEAVYFAINKEIPELESIKAVPALAKKSAWPPN